MKWAPLVLAGLAVAVFLPQQVRFAQGKPFGVDEGLEWGHNCAQPALELLVKGADRQCSPSPAYYLLEKAVGRGIAIRDERILVSYRALSLVAAAALVFALAGWLGARLGLVCALAALASLLGQPLFHFYAAESRPYSLALLLLTLMLLGLAEGARRDEPRMAAWTAGVAAASIGAALVLLTGAAQAVAACAVFLLLLRLVGVPLRSPRGVAALALMAACVACALYYRSHSRCLAVAGPLSVWGPQGRHLVGEVIRLVWTDGHAANALALVGCAAPVWAWRRGEGRQRSDGFAFALGLLVLGQLLLTVVLAAQVARSDYYFLPRLFLHLMVCRALLVALGGWLLLRLLEPTRWRVPAQAVAGLLAAAHLAVAFVLLRQEVAERREATPWHVAATAPCRGGQTPLAILLAGEPSWEIGPNALVESSHEARRCGWPRAGEDRYLLASADGAREIVAVPPAGAVPLRQCGREVVLRPR